MFFYYSIFVYFVVVWKVARGYEQFEKYTLNTPLKQTVGYELYDIIFALILN
jgi:hypothetical protein